MQVGLDLLNQKKWNEAITYFQLLKKQQEEEAFIYYLESFALQEMNLVDEAQKSLQMALKIDSQVRFNIQSLLIQDVSPMAQIIKCEHLISQEKYPNAMVICAQILSSQYQYLPAMNQRAKILFHQDNLSESNEQYEKMLLIKKDYLLAYLGKCQIFKKLKKYEEALKFLTIAQEYHPLQKCIYFQKSSILEKQYKFKESLFHYDLLLQIDKTDSQIYIERGNCLIQNKEYETAIWCFDKALTLVPEQKYDLSIKKGQALVKLQEYEQALELFDYCINSNPQNYDGYLQKSIALYEMKNFEKALIYCDKVLEMRQDIKEVFILKGNVIFKQYLSIDAIYYYDQVIQNFDDNLEAFFYKLRTLEILGLTAEVHSFMHLLIQSIHNNFKQIPKLPFHLQKSIVNVLMIAKNDKLLKRILNLFKQIEQAFNVNDQEQGNNKLITQLDKLLQDQYSSAIFFRSNYYNLQSYKLFMEQNFVKSFKFMDLAIKLDQDNYLQKFQKYMLLNKANFINEAEEYLKTLLSEMSKDIDQILYLFITLKSGEMFDEALIVIEKAIELMPDNFFIQQWKENLLNFQV